MAKRKLKTLKFEDKLKILKQVESGAKKKDVAVKFAIPASTLSTILKSKDRIFSLAEKNVKQNNKREKSLTFENVDKAMICWVQEVRNQNLPISGPILKEKAIQFANTLGYTNFKASNGWLEKFKMRYGIVQKTICGESAAVDQGTCNSWINSVLPTIIDGYAEDDIFNADETGLFFKCLPNKTLTFKDEKCHGGKHSKERVTCLLGANMSGNEKMKILMIGKSKNPRCFRGVNSLPVDYYNNKNSWMTSCIFEEWLLKEDKRFISQKRKIILFLDNCPAHPSSIQQKLKSIKLVFFPPNMTSKLQPMDQGVIQNLKVHYRKRLMRKILSSMDDKHSPTITLIDAIRLISKCWDVDVTKDTIKNCFRKAGFGEHLAWSDEDEIPLHVWRRRIHEEAGEDADLTQLFEACRNMSECQDVSLLDYVDIDNELLTAEGQRDEDIVNSVLNCEDSDCSEEEEEETVSQTHPKISAVEAVEVIRRALEFQENVPQIWFNSLNQIDAFFEKQIGIKKRQTIINEFFKSTQTHVTK